MLIGAHSVELQHLTVERVIRIATFSTCLNFWLSNRFIWFCIEKLNSSSFTELPLIIFQTKFDVCWWQLNYNHMSKQWNHKLIYILMLNVYIYQAHFFFISNLNLVQTVVLTRILFLEMVSRQSLFVYHL